MVAAPAPTVDRRKLSRLPWLTMRRQLLPVPRLRLVVAGTLLATTALLPAACRRTPATSATLRLGHFPNLTHAQALLGRSTGSFASTIGVPVSFQLFNAGPSAVEALLAGEVDACYVGPNPAVNGFLRSRGECFVIVAGASSGGAALVVRDGAGITRPEDFHGRKVATPQLGNTQDVAARMWFASHGIKPRDRGGDLDIIPLANPDQLLLLRRGEVDAAWTVEPWVSRLIQDAGARVFLDERELWPEGRYTTAVLVVRRAYLKDHPDVVNRLVAAHVQATLTLRINRQAQAETLAREIAAELGKELPLPIVRAALDRIEPTWDPLLTTLQKGADDAFAVGFLPTKPNLSGIFVSGPLEAALREAGVDPGALHQ
jgi:NitT/TauT family transport system substrate-binding protein